jgi:hypothetical protein
MFFDVFFIIVAVILPKILLQQNIKIRAVAAPLL